jgi:putative ABC transport system permease protein
MLKRMLKHLQSLLPGHARSQLDAELRFHIEKQTEANIANGLSPEEARRQATIAFGATESVREECYGQRQLSFLETTLYDVRHGLRGFRRNPGFTLTVIVTIAIGIGTTTAVFSIVDRILFRSLPYAHGDRLVSVGLIAPIQPQEFVLGGWYYDWRDHQTPFQSITSTIGVDQCDLTQQNPVRLSCAAAESSFLPTLGVTPLLGRNFTADEDRPNTPIVALISYQVWRSHFGGDAAIVGKTISLDGQTVRVIGVLPKEFEFPTLERADVLVPQALDEAAQRKTLPGRVMFAFARLKPGITIELASAALHPLFQQALTQAPPPFRKEVHLRVRSLRDRQVHDARLAAWIMLAAVIAVLLIAWANVASLLLARASARERELAVRSALGASRARLIRQTLTESLLLALAGAIAGMVLAFVLLRAFASIAPTGVPFLDRAGLDLRVAGFAIAVSLICGIVFGVFPALQLPRAESLAGRSSTSISHNRLRQSLVVTQIAVSLILLASAGLLLRSFWKLLNQPLGMHASSVVTATIALGEQRYPKPEQQMAFFQKLEAELRRFPGVNVLAMSDTLPPGGWHHDQIFASIRVAGRPLPAEGTGGLVAWRWVTPGYFATLNIPVIQGRGFQEDDRSSSDHFIIVSQSLADLMFPGQNPVGQHLQPGLEGPWYTVVGVAQNVKNSGLAGEDAPEYYRLRRDRVEDWTDWRRGCTIILRTSASPGATEDWLRTQVAALDPTVPVEITTMQEHVNELADRPRFESALFGLFAFVGVLLAAIGIYGVISFMVTQRTQEIGVRMALGATRGDVMKRVTASGARLVAIGVAAGLLASLLVSRAMASLLFGIRPNDLLTFVAVVLLLAIVALVATWIPARNASRIDPLEALRYE